MAAVLQCPDCGTRHPLDVASSAPSFRCKGCGRVLKVPAAYVGAGAAGRDTPDPEPAAEAAVARAPVATRTVLPAPVAPVAAVGVSGTSGVAPSRRLTRAAAGAVPFGVRLVLWMVAVPAGFIVVFGVARMLGLFTSTQFENVFLENGWNRFWPVARLLPIVALVTAALVQGGVEGVSRWRHRRAVGRMTASRLATSQTSERERARPA